MSHVSNISTDGLEFDLDVIKRLCQQQGWQFLENQKRFVWYGKFMNDSPVPQGYTPEDYGKCEHAIRIPGCSYELGLVPSLTGTNGWHILADFWTSGGLDKRLGKQGEVFRQLYLQTSDIMWAEEKNFGWEEVPVAEDGTRKLVVYVNEFEGGGEW